ncbi:unnamed protein product [Lathyrus oleraceus]|uniref:uncharacterized protein LOC127082597 n=1 Tax=Pisum sativum TaxID=3888 RepID=UPI001FC4B3F6|nr:uncharacterized protein LOC127082597 [Pisum sativum]
MAAISDQFSATSEENNINNTVAISMNKKNIIKPQSSNSKTSAFKFSEDASVCESKLKEHDFINSTKNMVVGSSSSSLANNEKKSLKIFQCNFCKNQFSSGKALGGHQNAHKKERALAEHGQEVNNGFESHHDFPNYTYNPSLPTIPYHGFRSYNRALGINMKSMIHKPTPNYSWMSPSAWTPMQEMKTYSFLDGLQNESVNANTATPTLKNLLKNLEVGIGESSINIANKANFDEENSNIVGRGDHVNHCINMEEVSEAESIELDLSLKL